MTNKNEKIISGVILTGNIEIKNGRKFVEVICKCGLLKMVRLDALIRSKDYQCTCSNNKWGKVEIGMVFGRLLVISDTYKKGKEYFVDVICECNTERRVRISSLLNGRLKSCGCLQREVAAKVRTTHDLSKHPLYKLWQRVKDRCLNPNNWKFKDYGGRNVRICKEWEESFSVFYEWAIKTWKPGLQLDKDILYRQKHGTKNGLMYSPEYCMFVTCRKNSLCKSTSHRLKYNGEEKTITEWAEQYNLNANALSERINRYDWPIEKAITQPSMRKFSTGFKMSKSKKKRLTP